MSKTEGPICALLVGRPESRHLRVPKHILPFGETTVVGRTMQAYLDAGFDEVILVLGYKADAIAGQIEPLPAKVRLVRNPLFDEGVGSYLRAGLREIGSQIGSIAVGLVDQPLLTSELLREFLEAHRSGGKPILVPVCQGALGLPAFFTKPFIEELSSLSEKEDLWDVIKRHGDEILDHPTGYTAVARSIEDMDDYHALLTMAGLPIPEISPPPAEEPQPAAEESESAAEEVESAAEAPPSATDPTSA